MKQLVITVLLLVAFVIGFAFGYNIKPNEHSVSFYGRVIQKLDSMLIVEGIPENDINHRGKFNIDEAYVRNEKDIVDLAEHTIGLLDIQEGSLVRITYTGEVLAISPSIIQDIISVEIIEDSNSPYAHIFHEDEPDFVRYCFELDELDGVSIVMEQGQTEYSAGAISLDVVWKNETEIDLMFGETFALQKKVDGEWKSLIQTENTGFNDLGYNLQPNSEMAHTYDVSGYFGELENGEYRIVTYFFEVGTAGSYIEYLLTSNFSVWQ